MFSKMALLLTVLVVLSAGTLFTDGTAAVKETEDTRVKRSDDLSFSELSALVHQQVGVIDTLQSELTAANNKIAALETTVQAVQNKLPQSFAQVAFTARFSADDSQNGIHLNPGQVLQFDKVVTNIGNAYNPKTGIFTAPVAGMYSFFLSIMGTNAHDYVMVSITKQGTSLDVVWAAGSRDIEDQGSSQVTTHLAAGEQVWVKETHGDGVRGGWYTIFTGYLVQAD